MQHLLEAGVHKLGLFGNPSEGPSLTSEERATLLGLIARDVTGKAPLIVSTGHPSTDIAVRQSRQAEDLGASAIMVLPPQADADGILYYYEAINRVMNIPIMIQDAPLSSQVALPAQLIAVISAEFGAVRYVKIEAPPTLLKITQVIEACQGRLAVIGGFNGHFMIEEALRGTLGTMAGSDLTSVYVEIWNRLRCGDTKRAWSRFLSLLPLIRFELQPGCGVSAIKHNLFQEGVIASPTVRHPTRGLDKDSLAELEYLRKLARIQLP